MPLEKVKPDQSLADASKAAMASEIGNCGSVSTFLLSAYGALSSVAVDDPQKEAADYAARRIWDLIGDLI